MLTFVQATANYKISGLKQMLEQFHDFTVDRDLKVNGKKSGLMKIVTSRDKNQPDEIIRCGGEIIPWVTEYVYLGVTLTPLMNKLDKYIIKKAQRASYALKKALFRQCSMEFAIDMFNKLVKPILLYGSEIWGPFWRPRAIRGSSAMQYATILILRT